MRLNSSPNVQFWPHTLDPRVASHRLRCAQIVQGLQAQGLAARQLPARRPRLAAGPGWLVLSKRYDADSLAAARAWRRAPGMRLALDLCDNHFHHSSDPDGQLARRAEQLRTACATVDRVIACSQALADVVRAEVPGCEVRVVEDAAEAPRTPHWWDRWRARDDWRSLAALRAWLARQAAPAHRRLVWFGNHGSPGVDGGMADLQALRPLLEAAHAAAPLTLTVISNRQQAWQDLVQGWRVPNVYLPWAQCSFSPALQAHSLALIPIRMNAFTRCKTANRVLTAALHGLNVAGDAIPSYEPLRAGCVLDDWPLALGPYLDDAALRATHRARLQALCTERYRLPQVLAQWRQALDLG